MVEAARVPEKAEQPRAEPHLLQSEVGCDIADRPPVAQRPVIPFLRGEGFEQVGGAYTLCVDRGPDLVDVHGDVLSS
jgi:hypothetical protein